MPYQTIAKATLFKNDTDRGPFMGNSKVEVLEDIKKGDIVNFALWKNEADPATGRDPSVSLSVQRKVEDEAPRHRSFDQLETV